jgi:hypothetical protein
MGKISKKVISQNSRLTDFPDLREIVIANKVKNVPNGLKYNSSEHDERLKSYS